MKSKVHRWMTGLLPPRVSERIYSRDRDLDVDYSALDYHIHVPTYNEEDYVERTLKSLSEQEPVKNGDVKLVLVDSKSDDNTVKVASGYVDGVIIAEEGKLTARNQAIEELKPDVVLSADAGDIYTPGWVDEHAKAFEKDNVIATLGPIYADEIPFKFGQNKKHWIVNLWNLPGNNSAIRTSALEEVGMFDTNIDEQELIEVLFEEQILKKLELKRIGDIEFRPYAAMYKNQRRKKFSASRTRDYAREQAEDLRF